MDAEAERPVVLIFRDSRTTADQERAVVDNHSGVPLKLTSPAPTLALCILEYSTSTTHVEVLGDVPLRPRTNPPSVPVIRAAEIGGHWHCPYKCARCERGAGAQHVIRWPPYSTFM